MCEGELAQNNCNTHHNTPQHTATHYNTDLLIGIARRQNGAKRLQHTATHCNTPQHVQHTATHCTTDLLVGDCAKAKWRETILLFCRVWSKCVAVCCSVLQCVAGCCSVLQCVAVCCSVLQCVAKENNTQRKSSGKRHTKMNVMSHVGTSYVTRMSHGLHTNESYDTYECVMSHI